jgi:hypothetical protein
LTGQHKAGKTDFRAFGDAKSATPEIVYRWWMQYDE